MSTQKNKEHDSLAKLIRKAVRKAESGDVLLELNRLFNKFKVPYEGNNFHHLCHVAVRDSPSKFISTDEEGLTFQMEMMDNLAFHLLRLNGVLQKVESREDQGSVLDGHRSFDDFLERFKRKHSLGEQKAA